MARFISWNEFMFIFYFLRGWVSIILDISESLGCNLLSICLVLHHLECTYTKSPSHMSQINRFFMRKNRYKIWFMAHADAHDFVASVFHIATSASATPMSDPRRYKRNVTSWRSGKRVNRAKIFSFIFDFLWFVLFQQLLPWLRVCLVCSLFSCRLKLSAHVESQRGCNPTTRACHNLSYDRQ